MPYRLMRQESIESGVQRIAREQIDRAIGEIDDEMLGRHETVHQLRKRCKKIRGLLRLVRGGLVDEEIFDRENAWYRDTAKTLSYIRDAEALIETFEALIDEVEDPLDLESLEPMRAQLVARRRKIADEKGNLNVRLTRFRSDLRQAHERISGWELSTGDFDDLKAGLEKTYRRARKAFARTLDDPDEDSFHDWRKRVKYHWYHCRLLREVWPTVMRARRDEADRLAGLLGDEHDLAVLQHTLQDENEPVSKLEITEALLVQAARQRRNLQRLAGPLGQRLLAEKPKHLVRRIETYWTVFADPVPNQADEA